MSACRNCGSSLDECNTRLRDTGEACCPPCILFDTHDLVVAGQSAFGERLDVIERRLVEEEARQAIWRDGIEGRLSAIAAQIDLLTNEVTELVGAPLPEVEVDLGALTTGILQKLTGDLPDRVGVLERCLGDIEKKLKLTRRRHEQGWG